MTESKTRTWLKAILWQAIGLLSMTIIGYLTTGSLQQGGVFALYSTLFGLVMYVVYERLWTRISWGRLPANNDAVNKG